MSKIEIVTEENLSKEEGENLLSYLEEIVDGNHPVISVKITDTLRIRDCSKGVCSCDD